MNEPPPRNTASTSAFRPWNKWWAASTRPLTGGLRTPFTGCAKCGSTAAGLPDPDRRGPPSGGLRQRRV